MCAPDLTIFTYDWVTDDPEPIPNHTVKHMCVDWSQLEDYVDERQFSSSEELIRRSDGGLYAELSEKYQVLTLLQEQGGQATPD